MASLWQIDREIMELVDFETGELIDIERFEALQMERTQKIENIALYYKNLMADADAIAKEITALSDRKARCIKTADSLKRLLADALQGEKFSTAKCAVSFRRSTKLEITDFDSIPKQYITETVTASPDKDAIKAVIKSGQAVNGCRLVENVNAQIK